MLLGECFGGNHAELLALSCRFSVASMADQSRSVQSQSNVFNAEMPDAEKLETHFHVKGCFLWFKRRVSHVIFMPLVTDFIVLKIWQTDYKISGKCSPRSFEVFGYKYQLNCKYLIGIKTEHERRVKEWSYNEKVVTLCFKGTVLSERLFFYFYLHLIFVQTKIFFVRY